MRDKVRTSFHETCTGSVTDTTVYQVAHLSEQLAWGLLNLNVPVARRVVHAANFGGKKLPLNLWPSFHHLGKFMRIQHRAGNEAVHLRLPQPAPVVQQIEEFRLNAFRKLRQGTHSPDEFIQFLQTHSEIPVDFALAESAKDSIATYLFAYDLMLMFLRCNYNLLPVPDTGWRRGMKVEMELLSTKLKPRNQWAEFARRLVDEFEVTLDDEDDVGGFAIPTPGGGGGGGGGPGPGPGPDRRPERLLFYMSLPQFLEFRYLHKKNRYEYCVAVFTEDRVIVDTALNDNCLFGLEGPLVECMKVSPDFKDSVRNSPLCTLDKKHDPAGAWKVHVQQWLAGVL